MTELRAPLDRFVSIYHANPRLVADQAGWHCSILLAAADSGERIGLRVADGRVISIGDHDQRPDLIVTAPSVVLLEILELRRDPSEPYMFGELTVQGEERHFTRLDYVMTSLYPEP